MEVMGPHGEQVAMLQLLNGISRGMKYYIFKSYSVVDIIMLYVSYMLFLIMI